MQNCEKFERAIEKGSKLLKMLKEHEKWNVKYVKKRKQSAGLKDIMFVTDVLTKQDGN